MIQAKSVFNLMAITCSVLCAQRITVEPGKWIESGIDLTPYSSPKFAEKLAATSASTKLDLSPLHPFSFFLTNNTGRLIVAYSVLWKVIYPNGFAVRHQRLVGSLRSPSGIFAIPKGSDRLVTVLNGAVAPIVDNPVTDQRTIENLQAAVPDALKIFPSQGDVTITLEAVVLDDGLALGLDSTHAIPRLQAQVDAEKTLASAILGAFNGGGDQAVIDLLNGIVSRNDPNAPNPLTASRMASSADAYTAFLVDFRNQLARHYLGLVRSNPSMLKGLANQKMTEIDLVVH